MAADDKIMALIHLLDDPDQQVYQSVNKNLLSQGSDIIPVLEKAWESSTDELYQGRLEKLIQEINNKEASTGLKKWLTSDRKDLVDGACLLAKFQYPDLDKKEIDFFIDKIVKSVWLELNDRLTALEKIRILNHIIFEEYGFSGNQSNYYSPDNNYINSVLDTKKGNPLSLAIIYSAVAMKLDLPVYGVNLPKNFILAYTDKKHNDIPGDPGTRILFYINPFRQGVILNRSEIESFIKNLDLNPDPSFFNPCSNELIIQRLCLNLSYAYEKQGNAEKVEIFNNVYKILTKEGK